MVFEILVHFLFWSNAHWAVTTRFLAAELQFDGAHLIYYRGLDLLSVRFCHRIVLGFLLITQALVLLINSWFTAPGVDEWGHLPSGLYSWQHGDFNPYSVNPPLARMIAALPPYLMGIDFKFDRLADSPPMDRSEARLASAFVQQFGPNAFYWIFLSRTALIPISLLGTFLIWEIGLRLRNIESAWIAAILWASSPMVLAFGASIVPDVTAAVLGLLVQWRFYIWLRMGTNWQWIVVGVAVGVAMLSKLTWLILPPLIVITSFIYGVCHAKRWNWKIRGAQLLAALTLAWVTLHAGYLFRGTLRPAGEYLTTQTQSVEHRVQPKSSDLENPLRHSVLGRIPIPVPTEYLRGIFFLGSESYPSYLLSKWSRHGWFDYYVIGIFLKEPVAVFVLVGLFGFSQFFFQKATRHSVTKRGLLRLLGVPGVSLLIVVSGCTGFNHHIRYVLPFYPFAYLLAAKIGCGKLSGNTGADRLLRWALISWFVLSSMSIVPRSYAFFSEGVGSASQGWRYLNSSNLDWGQDLLTIKDWLECNPDKRPVYLLYSPSTLDLEALGIPKCLDGRLSIDHDKSRGPSKSGWWICTKSAMVDGRFRWFFDRPATIPLSVTTSIYFVEITDGEPNSILDFEGVNGWTKKNRFAP